MLVAIDLFQHAFQLLLDLVGLQLEVNLRNGRLGDGNLGLGRSGSHLKAVLLKGGHMQGEYYLDTLAVRDKQTHSINKYEFKYKRIDTQNTHGTGCSLSSAITAYLAQDKSLEDAVRLAGVFLQKAILNANLQNVGSGHGPINHSSGSYS